MQSEKNKKSGVKFVFISLYFVFLDKTNSTSLNTTIFINILTRCFDAYVGLDNFKHNRVSLSEVVPELFQSVYSIFHNFTNKLTCISRRKFSPAVK